MANELRHFMNLQNGPKATARIDFSDIGTVMQVRVMVEMEIVMSNSEYWSGFTHDVQALLNYANNPLVKT